MLTEQGFILSKEESFSGLSCEECDEDRMEQLGLIRCVRQQGYPFMDFAMAGVGWFTRCADPHPKRLYKHTFGKMYQQ